MITPLKNFDTISKAVIRQQGMMDIMKKTSNVSTATLAVHNKSVTDNIANKLPIFTTIVKMGNLFAPLSGN